MSTDEKSKVEPKPMKESARPKRVRRRSKSSKSSTASPSSPQPSSSPTPSQPAAPAPAVPFELMLDPGCMLKHAVESEGGQLSLKPTDQALAVMRDLVEGMKSGSDLASLRVPIVQLTGNQEERAKLIRSLMLTHDYSRLVNYLVIRDKLEQLLMEYAAAGQFTPAEGLAFFKAVCGEIAGIQQAVSEGAASGGDATTLLNRVSFAAKAQEGILSKKVNSSPQNRELVRRVIYRLTKLIKPSAK